MKDNSQNIELEYNSTNAPDIKIFVSHRIDQDNRVINDDVFIPVGCGAVYDNKNSQILGDDTGDNISKERFRLNEMTVLYWAWKNVEADYYGLCHYRRYFSFNEEEVFEKNKFQLIEEEILSSNTIEKHKINSNAVKKLISKNPNVDVFLPELFDISEIFDNKKFTNRKRHENVVGKSFADNSIDILLDVIKEYAPEYLEYANKYYSGHHAFFCDTFIMKKAILDKYCNWVYPLLFEFEKRINYDNLSMNQTRIAAYFSEDLFSIFCFKCINDHTFIYKELPLIYFSNTPSSQELKPIFQECKNAIVISSSNEYVPYVGTLLNSILRNSSDSNNYDITILQTDITSSNKRLIDTIIGDNCNFSVRYTNVSEEIIGKNFDVGPYTIHTFYRLLIPYLFSEYEKVLYLDADIVVNEDIYDLFNYNLEGKYIAAAPDIRYNSWLNMEGHEIIEYTKNTLKIDTHKHRYFNAGAIVYNIIPFINNIPKDKIMTLATSTHWKFVDQDVLNILCEGKTYYLPIKYNIMTTADDLRTEIHAPLNMYNEYFDALKTPAIIHYAGNILPVIYPGVDLYWHFWKYAQDTPFYELLIARMAYTHADPALVKLGIFDQRSTTQKILDTLFPYNSIRRHMIVKLFPYYSRRRVLLRNIRQRLYKIKCKLKHK